MHFFVPPWVRHGRPPAITPVYSVDLQPAAHRLATAGQDGAVKIWALPVIASHAIPAPSGDPQTELPAPVRNGLSDAPHADLAIPNGALLASLSSHTAAANCVRWAPTGDRLASGGDDAVVLVYERQEGTAPVSAFAAAGGAGAENWRVLRPFRAHSGDVTHVCWSPDGERIASASVDNLVVIWNVRGCCAQVRLEGHTGFVKGVDWDPVGKFVASQSDDRSVKIWRTSDWKEEKTLAEPFETAVYQENSTAFFLRLSWSPCGSQLLATNAHKKPAANCAPMFSRESGFSEQIEFVGHHEPVVCTRFSPRLYRARDNPASLPYTVLVLGSKDMGASVWQSSGKHPFFRMAEMFAADVIDLTWGSDGYTLVVCSTDGQVMYVKFSPNELGDVVPLPETHSIFKELWRQFGGAVANGAPPPEYPAQLRAAAAAAAVPPPAAPAPAAPVAPAPLPVIPEVVKLPSGPTPPADPAILAAQNEVRVRGGKRRIIPVAVAPSNGPSPVAPPAPAMPTVPLKRVRVDAASPFDAAAPPAANRSAPTPFSAAAAQAPVADAYANRFAAAGRAPVTALPEGAKPAMYATPLCQASVVGLSLMLLPSTNEAASGRCRIISAGETPTTILEAREDVSAAGGYTLMCTRAGKVLWRDYHPRGGAIVALAGIADKFAAAAATDGKLFVYSAASGRRILQPLVLDSAPHMLEAFCVPCKSSASGDAMVVDGAIANGGSHALDRWFLLVVSRSALCSVFDVREKTLVCARSAAPLLARPMKDGDSAQARIFRSIALARVTPHGEPLLVLSDRNAFAYSRSLRAWGCVAGDIAPNSEFTRGLPASKAVGPLRALQAGAGVATPTPARTALSGMSGLQRAAIESLSHLESLLEAAVALDAPEDYRYYLASYAQRVALAVSDDVESCELRLRELCDFLIGVNGTIVERTILGMSGRTLLEDTVLPVVATHRQLQRFVEEYSESLRELARQKKMRGITQKNV